MIKGTENVNSSEPSCINKMAMHNGKLDTVIPGYSFPYSKVFNSDHFSIASYKQETRHPLLQRTLNEN